MKVNSAELLFIKSVKDGIPNRDPLADSDARRIFGEEDGRISLSDVSIKRDVRDFVQMAYPDGSDQKNLFIFVREERDEKSGNLLGRGSLAKKLIERSGVTSGSEKDQLIQSAFDVRAFGVVFSVSKKNFKVTGPVQFGWAHSLHPVESRYIQGTVVMPSEDIKESKESSGKKEGQNSEDNSGKSQGTIWTSFIVPFAVFVMPGIINANIAKDSGLKESDVELLLEGLWRGTQMRQARGRGMQQPLFMMHVEYLDPLYRIGYLEDYVRLMPEAIEWRNGKQPSSIHEIQLDVSELSKVLDQNRSRIRRVRIWSEPHLTVIGASDLMDQQPLW